MSGRRRAIGVNSLQQPLEEFRLVAVNPFCNFGTVASVRGARGPAHRAPRLRDFHSRGPHVEAGA